VLDSTNRRQADTPAHGGRQDTGLRVELKQFVQRCFTAEPDTMVY